MLRLSWLVKLYENLTYVCMRPTAIALNYSIKDIRNDICQIIIIYIHEKSQLNRLVWDSLTLAPTNNEPSTNAKDRKTTLSGLKLSSFVVHEYPHSSF